MAFIEVKPEKLEFNAFNMIKNWMVLTAGTPDSANSMTVSWGAMGIMWGKPAATVYVRGTRYTKEFMDKEDYFTLSILPESYKQALGYLGSHSGRDGDKYDATDLHPMPVEGTMAIEEADYIFVMKKIFCGPMKEELYTDKDVYSKWYNDTPEGRDHVLYMGEIVKVLKKK
jgi:flavin reductase (DIM6/NTAB) family NADH-FMN oxidoreductase RutF